jgi:IS30 family transposase
LYLAVFLPQIKKSPIYRRGNKYNNCNSISEHPDVVVAKLKIAHWEDDTVESKDHKGRIDTFIDMKSKFLLSVK